LAYSKPDWRALSLTSALKPCLPHLRIAAVFSAVVNLLYLTPSIFMLQVYDRVIPTGGVTTLILLSIITLAGLSALSVLDWLRTRVLAKAGTRLDAEVAGPLLTAVMTMPALSRAERGEAMRDFDSLRSALGSGAAIAALDAPWVPIYLAAACLIHPLIGGITFFAGIVLLLLALCNERATHQLYDTSAEAASMAYARQGHMTAYASEIRALGMGDALRTQALGERVYANDMATRALFASQRYGSLIKYFRLVAQSAVLATAALLAIRGSISGGAIFATSLLLGRALAPIEMIVGSWKSVVKMRSSYLRISRLLSSVPPAATMSLPAPVGRINVEGITVATPQQDRVALADISFGIAQGEIIGVAGLSGAGKSTLLRALVGAVDPVRGNVRLDGAALGDWIPAELAHHVGYLPQEFVLFAGTIRENISRFQTASDGDAGAIDRAVVAAANKIGAHEMILRLPSGYDTLVGHGGIGLSVGQAQRIALARALFGSPVFVALDEPSANLDAEAKASLIELFAILRANKVTTIFASHDGGLLNMADKLLVLTAGRIAKFGPIRAEASLHPITRLSA